MERRGFIQSIFGVIGVIPIIDRIGKMEDQIAIEPKKVEEPTPLRLGNFSGSGCM